MFSILISINHLHITFNLTVSTLYFIVAICLITGAAASFRVCISSQNCLLTPLHPLSSSLFQTPNTLVTIPWWNHLSSVSFREEDADSAHLPSVYGDRTYISCVLSKRLSVKLDAAGVCTKLCWLVYKVERGCYYFGTDTELSVWLMYQGIQLIWPRKLKRWFILWSGHLNFLENTFQKSKHKAIFKSSLSACPFNSNFLSFHC